VTAEQTRTGILAILHNQIVLAAISRRGQKVAWDRQEIVKSRVITRIWNVRREDAIRRPVRYDVVRACRIRPCQVGKRLPRVDSPVAAEPSRASVVVSRKIEETRRARHRTLPPGEQHQYCMKAKWPRQRQQ